MEILSEIEEELLQLGFCSSGRVVFGEEVIVVGLFPYDSVKKPLPFESVAAYIDNFALKNHYGEMILRLQRLSQKRRQQYSLKRHQLRLFANSRLPEKDLAQAAGLGFKGKSTLLISPQVGVNTLIGGVILPKSFAQKDLPQATEGEKSSPCGDCRLCIEACPTGAITEKGLKCELCLQAAASKPGELPSKLLAHWDILYGCSRCRDACPYNRFNRKAEEHHNGEISIQETLGDWLKLAQGGEAPLKERLKTTALGQNWIDKKALIRNIIVICRRKGLFLDEVEMMKAYWKNEINELFSVDIPPFLEYS